VGAPILSADLPLHLEEHLAAATIDGSALPENPPEPVEWGPGALHSQWRRAYPFELTTEPARVVRISDGLRLDFTEQNRDSEGDLVGGVYVDVPGWSASEFAYVLLRARSTGGAWLGLGVNLRDTARDGLVAGWSRGVPLQGDGTIQTYVLPFDLINRGNPAGPWNQLMLWFGADREGSVEILSVHAFSADADYDDPAGVRSVTKSTDIRRAIYVHTPARLAYRVEVPPAGRLDLALGVVRDEPVTFEVTAMQEGGEPESLAVATHADPTEWMQRTVDLSHLTGQTVTLTLAANADPGTVALWSTPTVSGARPPAQALPNVIFYVIDGAAADHMSLYGYNRTTTPHLERLAEEGAVFERAYSNSSWTGASTPSFLTSLHTSAMGGEQNGRNMPPLEARTAAEILHAVGYQTAAFTTNPNAGTQSGLGRGLDRMREVGAPNGESSSQLHADFWRWREAYPGQPYWVHFQTTDVHAPNRPEPPFAGLYADPEGRATLLRWEEALEPWGAYSTPYTEAFEQAGVDRRGYFTLVRDQYDESMAQQDARIGQLVARLKEEGDWENTLLIIGSDHGHQAGTRHFGLGLLDPLPAIWEGAILSSFQSRIPLLFVWPGRIAGGQRFSGPVSMIDVLPTLLDLLDLPVPDYAQGQSLAPLLLGLDGWEPRPVIFDEFYVHSDWDAPQGVIEVLDGRWGASMYVGPPRRNDWIALRGHRDVPRPGSIFREGVPEETPRLLLYDVWNDPNALHSLHEERPDLVEKYSALLEHQLGQHLALAQRFTRSDETPLLTPEQLETLRTLGYIR
jgi:arylsulfatase A-like enzyme